MAANDEPPEAGGGDPNDEGEPKWDLSSITHPIIIRSDWDPLAGEGGNSDGAPSDPLRVVVAPVLAGFALAAVVVIGTATFSGHPLYKAAGACFVGSSVSLIFSMQMLALRRRINKTPRVIESILYELGLISLLSGQKPGRWQPRSA